MRLTRTVRPEFVTSDKEGTMATVCRGMRQIQFYLLMYLEYTNTYKRDRPRSHSKGNQRPCASVCVRRQRHSKLELLPFGCVTLNSPPLFRKNDFIALSVENTVETVSPNSPVIFKNLQFNSIPITVLIRKYFIFRR